MHILFRRVFLRGHVKFGFKLKIRTRSNRMMSRRGAGGLCHIYNTKKQANKLFKCHKQANNKLILAFSYISGLKLKEQAVMKNAP